MVHTNTLRRNGSNKSVSNKKKTRNSKKYKCNKNINHKELVQDADNNTEYVVCLDECHHHLDDIRDFANKFTIHINDDESIIIKDFIDFGYDNSQCNQDNQSTTKINI